MLGVVCVCVDQRPSAMHDLSVTWPLHVSGPANDQSEDSFSFYVELCMAVLATASSLIRRPGEQRRERPREEREKLNSKLGIHSCIRFGGSKVRQSRC